VEMTIAAVTTAGVLTIGVLESLVLAVGLTLVDVVRRSARPHDAVLGWVQRLGRYADVEVHASARVTAGVLIYRVDDRLFCANASYVRGRIEEAIRGARDPIEWIVLDAEAITHIDATGAAVLKTVAKKLRAEEITLTVARLKTATSERFEELGLSDEIGPTHFYPTVRAAVADCLNSAVRDRPRGGQAPGARPGPIA
jgi:SulP family sulfate permease